MENGGDNSKNENNNDKEPLLKQMKQQEQLNAYNINNKRLTNTMVANNNTTTNTNTDKSLSPTTTITNIIDENNNGYYSTIVNIQNSNPSSPSTTTTTTTTTTPPNCNNNNKKIKEDLNKSYENKIYYQEESFFGPRIPIMKEKNGAPALPFTFLRGLLVIVMVVIFLLLAASYFIEYRYLDIHSENTGELALHYVFIVTRPLVLIPLICILPLYGLNNRKTCKYSIIIGISLFLNIVGDCIYSFQINNQLTTDPHQQSLILNEMMYLFSLIFYMSSRLCYTIGFIIGIGKNSFKARLFHSIPFYLYAASLILLVVFSKSISKNNFQPLPDLINESSSDETKVFASSSSLYSSSSSQELTDMDAAHFSLIVIYGFIEATMVWRALSMLPAAPCSNSKMLLWLALLGATIFGVVDSLLVINTYYHPIESIFYLSNTGIWIANLLIVFSIPRRMDVKDYIFKVFRLNKRGIKIISKSRAFNSDLQNREYNAIGRKKSINNN